MPAHRKPTELHALQGTRPHDRAADLSSMPAGRPRIPRDVGPGLRKIFKHMCKTLAERRVLTSGDEQLIRLYVFLYDRHERNANLLRDEGDLVTYTRLDSHGQQVPVVRTNLRLKVVADTERQMTAVLNQLGLTPTAKDRAKVVGGARKDELVPGSLADLQSRGEFLFAVPEPIAPPTEFDPEEQI